MALGLPESVPLGSDGLPVGYPSDYGIASLAPEVLSWAETYLVTPDGSSAGEPWRWTDGQARFVMWFYALDAEQRFLFNHAQVVLPKGAGKSPLAAALSAIELCAPVVPDGFDHLGLPVGKPYPHAEVQLAAVSKDQADNTMTLVAGMLGDDSPARDVVAGLDVGLTRILHRKGKLKALTANAKSKEGGRPEFAVLDETHHWLRSNRGHELFQVIKRNLGKRDGRYVETTNAWFPGMDSVAETNARKFELMREGKTLERDMLVWHREAPADTDLSDDASLRAGLEYVYEGCDWINLDRTIQEIRDPVMTVDLSRRFYLNQVVTSTDALFSAHEWDVLAVDDRIEPGDEIVLGFDGGKTSDATALVACRVSDRMFQVMGVWENPGGTLAEHWEVPRDEVDDTVRHTMANYKVSAFFADVELWESYIQQWSLDYRNDLLVKASPKSWVAYDFRQHIKDVTLANERLISAVIDGQVKHTGDPAMRRHVLNVHRRLNNWGVSFGKENRWSKNKIDIYAAMVAADEARVRYLESGKRRISKRMVVGSW